MVPGASSLCSYQHSAVDAFASDAYGTLHNVKYDWDPHILALLLNRFLEALFAMAPGSPHEDSDVAPWLQEQASGAWRPQLLNMPGSACCCMPPCLVSVWTSPAAVQLVISDDALIS